MRIVLVALLAACGSDPGPHDVVKCGTGYGTCERACTLTSHQFVADCVGLRGSASLACMGNAFEFEGATGCCGAPPQSEMSSVMFVFYECQ